MTIHVLLHTRLLVPFSQPSTQLSMERMKLKDDDQIYPPPGYVMFRSIIFMLFYVPDITGVFLPGGFPGLETLCPVLYQSLVHSLRCLHSSGSHHHHHHHHHLHECGQCSSYLQTVEALITSITHTQHVTEVRREKAGIALIGSG